MGLRAWFGSVPRPATVDCDDADGPASGFLTTSAAFSRPLEPGAGTAGARTRLGAGYGRRPQRPRAAGTLGTEASEGPHTRPTEEELDPDRGSYHFDGIEGR